ncbi:MAG: hypothetical protein WC374_06385 [Phycisphaerae bacterium]
MSFETDAFDAIYESLTIARCRIRIGRTVIAKAICSGIGVNRQSTDEGQFGSIDANVRLLTADEPDGEIKNGTVIEVLQNGKDEKTGWAKARVGGRFVVGGLTRLILEAEHE